MRTERAAIGWWLLITVILLLMLVGVGLIQEADAATPATAYTHVKLTWTAPTVGCSSPPPAACDNVALDEPLTDYQIWIDTQPIPDVPTAAPTATVPAGTLTFNSYPAVPLGSTMYARILARNGTDAAHTGALTAQISVLAGAIVVKAPASPGVPTISVTYTTTPPAQ